MLQKADKTRLDKVLQTIENLQIRFPNAELFERMNKKTKVSKGQISDYLNGKKPISDNFYRTFIELFPEEEKAAEDTRTPTNTALDNMAQSNRIMAEAHLVLANNLAEITALLKESLSSSSGSSEVEEALLKRLRGLQSVVEDLGKGKLWKNQQEAQDYIHKKTYESDRTGILEGK